MVRARVRGVWSARACGRARAARYARVAGSGAPEEQRPVKRCVLEEAREDLLPSSFLLLFLKCLCLLYVCTDRAAHKSTPPTTSFVCNIRRLKPPLLHCAYRLYEVIFVRQPLVAFPHMLPPHGGSRPASSSTWPSSSSPPPRSSATVTADVVQRRQRFVVVVVLCAWIVFHSTGN